MGLIDPAKVAFYTPGNLKKFKQELFERVAVNVRSKGGLTIYHKPHLLDEVPDDYIPIVGCHPELRSRIDEWTARGRTFVYWDRGHARRIFATWLPKPTTGSGYYRWEINAFQMKAIRDVPGDRWKALNLRVSPWNRNGRHIVVALPSETYNAFHRTHDWAEKTVAELKRHTDRKIVLRQKLSPRPLSDELRFAHALVTHQSNAANEAIIFGCPVFCDAGCAASLVGLTDLSKIETPVYPERQPWLNSIAYSQYDEAELINGTLWNLIA